MVDDGSAGSTTDVVRERQTHDDSVRLISQKNVAPGAARTARVTAARTIPALVDSEIRSVGTVEFRCPSSALPSLC